MKKAFPALLVILFLASSVASAQVTIQKWSTGWDIFSEPLNLTKSNVKWSVSPADKLTVTYTLIGATPNKLYQVGVHIYCTTIPPTWGQFPTSPGGCLTITKQGVTASVAAVELGVVTTDLHGNGSFKVVVGPIASGTYNLEFNVRNGAGCNLIGGAGSAFCAVDFQSPGPFGTATTITLP